MAGRGVHGLEHVCLAKLVQIGDGLVFKIRVLLFFQKLQVCHAIAQLTEQSFVLLAYRRIIRLEIALDGATWRLVRSGSIRLTASVQNLRERPEVGCILIPFQTLDIVLLHMGLHKEQSLFEKLQTE